MITEDDLREANGLVAHYHRACKKAAPAETLFRLELRLLQLGVKIDNPVGAPDPHAPPGGSAIAMRKVAYG